MTKTARKKQHRDQSAGGPTPYLLLLGEDPLTDVERLLVLVHLVVFLVHPLVEGVCVQDPLSMNLCVCGGWVVVRLL